jgi:nucleotide-binding universal stress UspA family protein
LAARGRSAILLPTIRLKEATMKTIVVGYDDTEPAKRALSRAADLAAAFSVKPIVLSVAPALVPAGRGIGPIDPTDPPEEHREQLKHAAAFLEERGLTAEYEVALGDPSDWIVELAERRGADLIVVGTREPGLISRLLGLSVSGSVQRKAHCDVLIVH